VLISEILFKKETWLEPFIIIIIILFIILYIIIISLVIISFRRERLQITFSDFTADIVGRFC